MVVVDIIYDFVKIIYYQGRRGIKQHKKAWKCHLPELRVTTPSLSNKFSTPKQWRKRNLFLRVPIYGTFVVNWSSRTASNRYYVYVNMMLSVFLHRFGFVVE